MGIFIFGEQLILMLYGQKWEIVSNIFIVFGLFAALSPLFANAKTACMGIHRQHWVQHAYSISILSFLSAIFLASQLNSMKLLSLGYGVGLLFGLIYMFVRLKLHGITLRLFELFTLPLLWCIVFLALVFMLNSMQVLPIIKIIYLSGLFLLYPALILSLEGSKIWGATKGER